MSIKVNEMMILVIKIGINISLLVVAIVPIFTLVHLISNFLDHRLLEQPFKTFVNKVKRKIMILAMVFVVAAILLIIFYRPLDVINPSTNIDSIRVLTFGPKVSALGETKELNKHQIEAIMEELKGLKCRRSISSGSFIIDEEAIQLTLMGSTNKSEHKYIQIFITERNASKTTFANTDFMYKIDVKSDELIEKIKSIIN